MGKIIFRYSTRYRTILMHLMRKAVFKSQINPLVWRDNFSPNKTELRKKNLSFLYLSTKENLPECSFESDILVFYTCNGTLYIQEGMCIFEGRKMCAFS